METLEIEALASSIGAVAVGRARAVRDREAALPELALSLNAFAIRLAECGRRSEALAAAQEFVALERELAARDRDTYLPALAAALGNLGHRLFELGRRDDATAAYDESLVLRRALHATRDANLPRALLSLARIHAAMGDCAKSAALNAEAESLGVAIRQP